MGNKKRVFMLLAAVLLLTATAVLAFSPAMARYRAEITGDWIFQAKPPEKLNFAASNWTATSNTCTLTFSMDKDVEKCRVYLAVSEGIIDAEKLQVSLQIPGEENVTLEGTCQQIPEVSGLAKRFGQGYVYYFYLVPEQPEDPETPTEPTDPEEPTEPEEWIFSPKANEQFKLTVTGLGSAAEATTLMRLFVEQAE